MKYNKPANEKVTDYFSAHLFCIQIAFLNILLLNIWLSQGVLAQGEANFWYFGNQAGLDFSSGFPQVLTDGRPVGAGGTTTAISDANGKLLFYSDGHKVRNRLHQTMPYGEINITSNDAFQVVAVPQPGNEQPYYVFTVNDDKLLALHVDMSLDGGLGDIRQVIEVDRGGMTGALTAVRHQNGIDIWVMVRMHLSNAYHAYLITTTGITYKPIVSTVGRVGTLHESHNCYMKFTPDGRKLAVGFGRQQLVQILDFNDATGILSNPVSVRVQEAGDMEIYPCPLLLYVREENNFYQYDLRSGDSITISRSKTLLATNTDPVDGAGYPGITSFQLGPDSKIYIGVSGQSYLHVIPHPQLVGANCGFENKAIDLQGRIVYQGLVCFMRSYLQAPEPPPLDMPNVFTPNGDHANEFFSFFGHQDLSNVRFSIYNRWGRLVYESRDADRGWDGAGYPTGVYYWLLSYTIEKKNGCNKKYTLKGIVSLLR